MGQRGSARVADLAMSEAKEVGPYDFLTNHGKLELILFNTTCVLLFRNNIHLWITLYPFIDYRFVGRMGEGTFSEVLKCQSFIDGKLYACKKMKQKYDKYVLCTCALNG